MWSFCVFTFEFGPLRLGGEEMAHSPQERVVPLFSFPGLNHEDEPNTEGCNTTCFEGKSSSIFDWSEMVTSRSLKKCQASTMCRTHFAEFGVE
jgi:hypothetical protein